MSLLSWFRGIANAVSYADTGPYRGAPRDPELRVGDEQSYSTVRYATSHVAHTATAVTADDCPRCGHPLAEAHELQLRGANATTPTGTARACRHCEPDSWLLASQMSRAARARARAARHIV